MQSRKRIIGNWSGFWVTALKSGLSGVGHTDQSDIGNDLQTQPQPFSFSRPARFGITGRLIGRGFKRRVAAAAVPAFGSGR